MELNKLCYVGNLREVREYVEKLDSKALSEKISSRRGAFGYTPLHEAVASGKAEVLGYLLEKTNGAHINCKDVCGYTPLHLAASSGNLHCVKWLLEYSADMHTADEHGRTPKLTAELNCRRNIVRMLISAGTVLCAILCVSDYYLVWSSRTHHYYVDTSRQGSHPYFFRLTLCTVLYSGY